MRFASLGVIIATLAVSGCATGGAARVSTGPEVATRAPRTDFARVQKIEAVARLRGVRVIWIHPRER